MRRPATHWIGQCALAILVVGCQRHDDSAPAPSGADGQALEMLPTSAASTTEGVPTSDADAQHAQLLRVLRDAPGWAFESDERIVARGPRLLQDLSAFADKETAVVRRVIAEYRGSPVTDLVQTMQADGKLYVLNRLFFNVPEWVPRDKACLFVWSLEIPVKNDQVNVLWPLARSRSGSLELIDSLDGYSGERYDALGEFDYFESTYGRRRSPAPSTAPASRPNNG